MKKCPAWRTAMLVAICAPGILLPASKSPDYVQAGKPVSAPAKDSSINALLREISAQKIRATIEKLVTFNNRNTLSSTATDLKAGTGVLAAANWIESQYKSYSEACGGCLEVKRDTFTAPVQARIPQPTKLVNVYAVLRGSDPSQANRMYLVTGHYDSRSTNVLEIHAPAPGANDDASGVAVSLECARVLSRRKFPATIVFAAVPGEEQGLVGSAHLAGLAKAEKWDLEAVLNNDIVGGNTTPGDTLQDKSSVRVFSEGIPATATPEQMRQIEALGAENDSPSRQLARHVFQVGETYLSSKKRAFHAALQLRHDRFLRGGDHTSFNKAGFAAVRFTEWREDFNHQHQNVRTEQGIEYGDLLKFVDFNYVAEVAKINAASLASLASAPGAPRDVRVLTRNLDNNTLLSWKEPQNTSTGTTYQIVWRPTTDTNWKRVVNSIDVGDNAEGDSHNATLPVSKDNVFFGVRAVGANGHPGLAVAPVPLRERN